MIVLRVGEPQFESGRVHSILLISFGEGRNVGKGRVRKWKEQENEEGELGEWGDEDIEGGEGTCLF